jgi:hypothetical protein
MIILGISSAIFFGSYEEWGWCLGFFMFSVFVGFFGWAMRRIIQLEEEVFRKEFCE